MNVGIRKDFKQKYRHETLTLHIRGDLNFIEYLFIRF